MKRVLILTCVLISGFSVNTSQARTYWVDNLNPAAADSGSGTYSIPFQHIMKASQVVAPGDSVIVRPGTYHEILRPMASGQPDNWITYLSEEPHEAVLEGRVPLALAAAESSVWQEDTSTPDNIWTRELARWNFVEAWRDDERMPSPFDGYSNYYFEFQEGYSQVVEGVLSVWLTPGDSPGDDSHWAVTLNHGVQLENWDGSLSRNFICVEGFTCRRFALTGIQITQDFNIVRGNLCEWNGRASIGAMYCGTETVLIEGNEARYNSGDIGFSQGISIFRPSGPNNIFVGNVSHHNFDGGPEGSDGNGFLLDTGEADGGAIFLTNIAYDNAGAGFGAYQSNNGVFINNTSVNNALKEGPNGGVEMFILSHGPYGRNFVLRNNILVARIGPGRRALSLHYTNVEDEMDVYIDHNLYARFPDSDPQTTLVKVTLDPVGGETRIFELDQNGLLDFYTDHEPLPQWGNGSVFGDPVFADFDRRHLYCRQASPAVNAGSDEDIALTDFSGGPRVLDDVVDMGAYEFDPDKSPVGDTPAPKLLLQAWPNPFNPSVTVRFTPRTSGPIRLAVYDLAGHLNRVLLQEDSQAGSEIQVKWDGRDGNGRSLPSGIYFCRLTDSSESRGIKLMLLK